SLRTIDIAAALAQPEVVGIFTAHDMPAFGPLPVNPLCAAQPFVNPVLAKDAVHYVGQPIALVVGETAEAALAGVECVVSDIDPQPAVIGIEAALTAPAFLPGWETNIAYRQAWAAGTYDEAAAGADALVTVEIETSRVAPSPLEPRGLLARWQADHLICHLPSQAPHRARRTLATMLGLDEARLQVVSPQVGGAFGGRASVYPEEVAVAWAALHLKRDVLWQSSRGDDLISASHGRASRLRATGAFTQDGRLLALKAVLDFDLGSWAPFSALVPGWNAGRILPGPYAVPIVDVESRGLVTNTAGVGIYRGAGRPEAAMVMERLMDAGARRLGLDPVEIRLRNLPPDTAHPVESVTGLALGPRRAQALLAQATQRAGYAALKAEVDRRRAGGECVGLGINLYIEPCGMGWESARLTAHPDGRFTLASGSSSQGQGHDTAFAQIAATALGVSVGQVTVIEADTRVTPEGIGALASRSMAIGGSAVLRAAERLSDLLKNPSQNNSASGHGQKGETIPEEGLTVTEVYTAPAEAWSAGCCIAVVAVDPATGTVKLERAIWVDDCGRVINPLLAEAQLAGGFAQGLGETFCESILYDTDGQIVTGSLMDYALPRADDLIALEIAHFAPTPTQSDQATPTPENPDRLPNALGASGVGESGTIAAPAALANAVVDALSAERGCDQPITRLRLPLKPEAIWRMMQKKRT
ncbi:MAG: xanthine dehydrogenase family protein molybdopterin-binding subunit, partial [Burkholderiaceae bacterium]